MNFMSDLNTIKKEKSWVTVMTVGFMIFATFFGAGNLIFPPYLGVVGGNRWWVGFIAFILGDVVLGVMGLCASGKYPKTEIGVYYRVGRKFMIILGAIGTFFGSIIVVLPRTAATSLEVAVRPLAPNFPSILFLALFFILAGFCAIRPTKVVDIVGKYLTPALLVVLIILFIVGFARSAGADIRPGDLPTGYPSFFSFGIIEGLQTMDGPTGTMIAVIIIMSLQVKGITKSKDQTKTIIKAGFVAGICCIIVYLGLLILGLFYSNSPELLAMYTKEELDRTFLLNHIIRSVLGPAGTVVMGIVVFLATFTTCIGCIGLTAQYYSRIIKGLKYEVAVIIGLGLGFIMALISYAGGGSGVTFILKFAIPLLLILFPGGLVLMVLNTFFADKINNDNVFRGAYIVATLCGIATAFPNFPVLKYMVDYRWNPLVFYGFGSVIPAIAGGIIGQFIKWHGYDNRPYLRENAVKD
jgi:LIVCS family branched-chain amino acid:cation transporter